MSRSFLWVDESPQLACIGFLTEHEWLTYSIGVMSSDPEEKMLWREKWASFLSRMPAFSNRKHLSDFADIGILLNPGKKLVAISIFTLVLSGKYLKLQRGSAQ